MRLKFLAKIGLAAIVLGLAVVVIFSRIPIWTWTPKTSPLVHGIATTLPGTYRSKWVFGPYIPQGSRNAVINGTVKELSGHRFIFYIFTEYGYKMWDGGRGIPLALVHAIGNGSSISISRQVDSEEISYKTLYIVFESCGTEINVQCDVYVLWEEGHDRCEECVGLGEVLLILGVILMIYVAVVTVVKYGFIPLKKISERGNFGNDDNSLSTNQLKLKQQAF